MGFGGLVAYFTILLLALDLQSTPVGELCAHYLAWHQQIHLPSLGEQQQRILVVQSSCLGLVRSACGLWLRN